MHSTIRPAVTVVTMLVLADSTGAQSGPPILAPVGERVLSSDIVALDTVQHGVPHSISITPSALKAKAGVITTLPSTNARLEEGDVMLTASGRPVFVLQGAIPTYRDLVPGTVGDDVLQLEQALARLGFDPGAVDRTYDERTGTAVAKWYDTAGWEPFGPTIAQLAEIRKRQESLNLAERAKLAATNAAAAATAAVASARAKAEHADNVATADVETRAAARDKANANLANAELAVEAARATADHSLKVATAERAAKGGGRESSGERRALAVETARAKAKYANQAAKAEMAAKTADRALVMMDPRQTETARAAAEAQLELARAAASQTRLEGEAAVQAAERDARLAEAQVELVDAAVKAARLEGEVAVRAALNAAMAAKRDLESAQGQLGLARAAARINQLEGEAAVQAAIDAQRIAELDLAMATEQAALLAEDLDMAKRKVGVQVPADEVVFIATLPVRVEQTTVLVGDAASGPVMVVTGEPKATDSSLPRDVDSLAKPGTQPEHIVVEPGLSTDGFAELTPVEANLAPGRRAIVGSNNSDDTGTQ